MEYLPGNLEIENNPIELDFWDRLTSIIDQFEGITGYKIPSLGFRAKDEIPSFIVRSKDFGIVIFDVISDKIVDFDDSAEFWKTENGDFIYSRDLTLNLFKEELENRLKKNKNLFDIRKSSWLVEIKIQAFLIFAANSNDEVKKLSEGLEALSMPFAGSEKIDDAVRKIFTDKTQYDEVLFDIVDSVLDGSEVFDKTKKKKIQPQLETMNDFIKKSLAYTFKLDKIQRQIAFQVPPGPQRIRGLAGTGKTVILCMKAALAHKDFPDLKILFVFNTQSMYNQVRNAITEYYFNEAKSMPNWDKLHVLHAWGGSSKGGLYYNTANASGINPKTFFNVRTSENPLEAIYSDLLINAKGKIIPEYDIVLIDEAQDFSPAFFETVFYLTKPVDSTDKTRKRIIWAYDEFQSLTDLKISQPEDLFGKSENRPNMPNSVLEGKYKGNIEKDFILPNSYRNPRVNLMVAHGLALGIYSKQGKVPMESRRDWIARGYTVHFPNKEIFKEGDTIRVERSDKHSKNILERLLKENQKKEMDLVTFIPSKTINDQLQTVINRIDWLVNQQRVEPEEIIVINLDVKNSKSEFEYIRQQLDVKNIKAITPGFVEPTDSFKEPGFVTLSTTFRAKGNEANIVFIINTQKAISDLTFKSRNAIFVSVTRSRGWCYLLGFGEYAAILEKEIKDIVTDYPFFNFTFPSEEQIRRKLTIIQSTKDVERVDKDIDKLLADEAYRALLLEKLAQDPELLKELGKIKNNDRGTSEQTDGK